MPTLTEKPVSDISESIRNSLAIEGILYSDTEINELETEAQAMRLDLDSLEALLPEGLKE